MIKSQKQRPSEKQSAFKKHATIFAPSPMRSARAAPTHLSVEKQKIDPFLGGGLSRAALHEIYAKSSRDAAAATGFALGLAWQAAAKNPIIWVRQYFRDVEAGAPYAPGVAEFGLDETAFVFVQAKDALEALQAGLEAARCKQVGAVVIELSGETSAFCLTASRRLTIAAEQSGVTILLSRAQAAPGPSSADTRWGIKTAPSRALLANAPGRPALIAALLRNRRGLAEREWRLEWDRDKQCFAESAINQSSLSRPLVSHILDGQGAQSQRLAG